MVSIGRELAPDQVALEMKLRHQPSRGSHVVAPRLGDLPCRTGMTPSRAAWLLGDWKDGWWAVRGIELPDIFGVNEALSTAELTAPVRAASLAPARCACKGSAPKSG